MKKKYGKGKNFSPDVFRMAFYRMGNSDPEDVITHESYYTLPVFHTSDTHGYLADTSGTIHCTCWPIFRTRSRTCVATGTLPARTRPSWWTAAISNRAIPCPISCRREQDILDR